jgi:hypothetical protein
MVDAEYEREQRDVEERQTDVHGHAWIRDHVEEEQEEEENVRKTKEFAASNKLDCLCVLERKGERRR